MSERAQAQWSGAKGLVRLAKARLLGMPLWDAAPPTTVDQRGGLAYLPGGTGVADQALVVYKQSDDTYATKDLLAAVAVPTIAHTTAVLKGDNAGNAVAATGGTDYANASHTHAASDVVSGTMATARLGSGSASASTYLRGDQTWATVSAGALTLVNSQSFSAVSSLAINSIFTSTYRNYRIVLAITATSASAALSVNLRASGTNAAGSSDYRFVGPSASFNTAGTHYNPGSSAWSLTNVTITAPFAATLDLFAPAVATPTMLTVIAGSASFAAFAAWMYHQLSTAYDGLSIAPSSGNMTGTIRVYGYQD